MNSLTLKRSYELGLITLGILWLFKKLAEKTPNSINFIIGIYILDYLMTAVV